MAILYSRFWVSVTAVLSVVFVVLFFPVVRETFRILLSVLFMAAGVAVIWLVYLARHMYSRGKVRIGIIGSEA